MADTKETTETPQTEGQDKAKIPFDERAKDARRLIDTGLNNLRQLPEVRDAIADAFFGEARYALENGFVSFTRDGEPWNVHYEIKEGRYFPDYEDSPLTAYKREVLEIWVNGDSDELPNDWEKAGIEIYGEDGKTKTVTMSYEHPGVSNNRWSEGQRVFFHHQNDRRALAGATGLINSLAPAEVVPQDA